MDGGSGLCDGIVVTGGKSLFTCTSCSSDDGDTDKSSDIDGVSDTDGGSIGVRLDGSNGCCEDVDEPGCDVDSVAGSNDGDGS